MKWILPKKQHLADDNNAAMANLDKYAAKVSKGKDLALLCHLLEVTGFPDHQLGEHMLHGWPVIGRPSVSHVFLRTIPRIPTSLRRSCSVDPNGQTKLFGARLGRHRTIN